MKPVIAIVAGGYSSENTVSLQSAAGLLSFIDKDQYQVYEVILTRNWQVVISKMNNFLSTRMISVLLRNKNQIRFCIHHHTVRRGRRSVAGLFRMIGIPYSNCEIVASAPI